jgi:short-subunit dehydrogenase
MLSARSAEPLAHAANELRATGAEVAAHAADVGKPENAAALVDAAVAAYGGLSPLRHDMETVAGTI